MKETQTEKKEEQKLKKNIKPKTVGEKGYRVTEEITKQENEITRKQIKQGNNKTRKEIKEKTFTERAVNTAKNNKQEIMKALKEPGMRESEGKKEGEKRFS